MPVKAEPPGALAPPPTDPGTMAMYEEEGLDESAYDENYQGTNPSSFIIPQDKYC